MVYLSAQPDSIYFIWQLEIQLRNFHDLGIEKDCIHVIAGYDKGMGLRDEFQKFIKKNEQYAHFYAYPDLREEPRYTPSIRPHILKQHFAKFPELARETLFYHDSDILFSRIPRIEGIEKGTINYVSDTHSYLDIDYIRRVASEQLLMGMADIVGIPVEVIERNKHHTGGAQYILKSIDAAFWGKVENDSEDLYILMRKYNTGIWEREYPEKGEYRSKKRGIQAWCADMWAVLWNLWLLDKAVEIHSEMDFSWPYSPIEDWDSKAIQHYSGNIKEKEKFFKKNEYLNFMPWYDDSLLEIPQTSCSSRIVALIHARKRELDAKRKSFPHSCIVLYTHTWASPEAKAYELIGKYLAKYLAVAVCLYFDGPLCHQDRIAIDGPVIAKSRLFPILENQYEQLLWLPLGTLVDIRTIADILTTEGTKNSLMRTFMAENQYKVDSLFTETFSKVLDADVLHLNRGKFNTMEVDGNKPIVLIGLPTAAESTVQIEQFLVTFGRLHVADNETISAVYHII